MPNVCGTFSIVVTPEAHNPDPPGGKETRRFGLEKTLSGPLAGFAIRAMISAGIPEPGEAAVYTAIDQFCGTPEGKSSGLVLDHRATTDNAGQADLSVIIAPDRSTGALVGIAGSLVIEMRDGQHHYSLNCTLPPQCAPDPGDTKP